MADACVIGVDLGGTKLLAGAVDAQLSVHHRAYRLARPANERAEAAARRLGMTWVGETDKYYDLRLNVYRIRTADLIG